MKMLESTVTSKDSTIIAFEVYGRTDQPALILVTGALGVRRAGVNDELSLALENDFRVINYDRRGRGKSTDTQPYAIEREIEDIEALINFAGGKAALWGLSSGAALALEAANALGNKVTKAVLYEPPYIVDDSRPPLPDDYVQSLNAAIASGDRSGAVELFMTKAIGIPAEYVQMMKIMPPQPANAGEMTPPAWSEMEAIAHTIAYDGLVMRQTMSGQPIPAGQWPNVTADILFVTGGNSEPFFANGAKSAAAVLPKTAHTVLEGQGHAVSPQAVAPVIRDFLKG